jgi:hypothetical protein
MYCLGNLRHYWLFLESTITIKAVSHFSLLENLTDQLTNKWTNETTN